MIGWPRDEEEHRYCREFLRIRGVEGITPHAHMLLWVARGDIQWAVALENFFGRTCQIHWAGRKTQYVPREMRYFCFTYSFRGLGLLRLFGVTDSNNERAMRIQRWLGFREVYRANGCANSGGDIIFLEMRADECKWIRSTNGQKLASHS